MTKEMVTRLNERLRVYKDSPAAPANWADLTHLVEDILEIHQNDNPIGFNGNGKQESK